MITDGEFLWALDDFFTRLETYHGTSSDWVGVCVAGEYIVDYSLIIIIFYKNNKNRLNYYLYYSQFIFILHHFGRHLVSIYYP